MNIKQIPKKLTIILLLLSFIGGLTVWYATSPHGPGISGDAIHFLSGAETLGGGRGFINTENEYIIHTPPLFSILFLIGSLFPSVSFIQTGQFINIFL